MPRSISSAAAACLSWLLVAGCDAGSPPKVSDDIAALNQLGLLCRKAGKLLVYLTITDATAT